MCCVACLGFNPQSLTSIAMSNRVKRKPARDNQCTRPDGCMGQTARDDPDHIICVPMSGLKGAVSDTLPSENALPIVYPCSGLHSCQSFVKFSGSETGVFSGKVPSIQSKDRETLGFCTPVLLAGGVFFWAVNFLSLAGLRGNGRPCPTRKLSQSRLRAVWSRPCRH